MATLPFHKTKVTNKQSSMSVSNNNYHRAFLTIGLCLLLVVTAHSQQRRESVTADLFSPWGVSAHPLADREWNKIDFALTKVREAGIRWLREDFRFSRICRDAVDTYYFEDYDKLLEKAEKNGIRVLPILQAYDNELAQHRPDLVPIYEHPEEWRRFVRATVAHYRGKLRHWEIWNEPDGGFWKPAPDASQYVRLLKIAYEEIKKIDTANRVIIGGLISWNAEYMQSLYNAGAKGYFDAVAVHPYHLGPDANPQVAWEYTDFRKVLASNGQQDIEIWITESGGTSFKGQLISQNPRFMLDAIGFALNKLDSQRAEPASIGLVVSPRIPNDSVLTRKRPWLPGVTLKPLTLVELADIPLAECPVVLGAEGINIDEPVLQALTAYVKRGGLLLAVNKVPLHTVHFQISDGTWQRADRYKQTYAALRMGLDAFWTAPHVPPYTSDVTLGPDARAAGLPSVENLYVDRFLHGRNMQEGDTYFPIVKAFHEGNYIGDGMALYTYGDWKGGILISTLAVETGYSEREQANLLQRMYLTYLAEGIQKIFWYDLHNDGANEAEREHNFGLLQWDWTEKEAYRAYREMTEQLGANPKFLQSVPTGNEAVRALLFQRGEDDAMVLTSWANEDDLPYRFELGGHRIEGKGNEVRFQVISNLGFD